MNKEQEHMVPLTESQTHLIGLLGDLGNQQGLPPSCAQMVALLMISDKIELTFDEIRQTLGLSKSATSNAINFLLEKDSIEYTTRLGDRKRYFRSKITSWKSSYLIQFQRLQQLTELLNKIRSVRTSETIAFNNSLDELISFMEYFLNEITKIFDRWETKK